MPVNSGLTDYQMTKLYHADVPDSEIARMYGISVSAVGARRRKLNLPRKSIAQRVNAGLMSRWTIQDDKRHHSEHTSRALKTYIRMRLGDKVSPEQKRLTDRWVERLIERDVVVCYDPERQGGWYYRPRAASDERRVVDWPADIPFPDEDFKKALDLPED